MANSNIENQNNKWANDLNRQALNDETQMAVETYENILNPISHQRKVNESTETPSPLGMAVIVKTPNADEVTVMTEPGRHVN